MENGSLPSAENNHEKNIRYFSGELYRNVPESKHGRVPETARAVYEYFVKRYGFFGARHETEAMQMAVLVLNGSLALETAGDGMENVGDGGGAGGDGVGTVRKRVGAVVSGVMRVNDVSDGVAGESSKKNVSNEDVAKTGKENESVNPESAGDTKAVGNAKSATSRPSGNDMPEMHLDTDVRRLVGKYYSPEDLKNDNPFNGVGGLENLRAFEEDGETLDPVLFAADFKARVLALISKGADKDALNCEVVRAVAKGMDVREIMMAVQEAYNSTVSSRGRA